MGINCIIAWSRDRLRHVTPKGQLVTLIRLERNISRTARDAIYSNNITY